MKHSSQVLYPLAHPTYEGEDSDLDNLSMLAVMFEEPLTYSKQFAEALQNINLGYFVGWFADNCSPGEWIRLNDMIVAQELGLSSKQWRCIREDLIQRGLLLNKRSENGESLFTLDDYMLEDMLRQRSDVSVNSLGSLLSINKLQMKTLSGLSIKALIMLAAIQKHTEHVPLHERGDTSSWVKLPIEYVTETTYLSRHDQEKALEALKRYGIAESKVEGVPGTRYCRYSLKQLGDLTSAYMGIF